MDSSTIAHDLRAREWRQIILEANNSDIPKSQYIREHHRSGCSAKKPLLKRQIFHLFRRLSRLLSKRQLPPVCRILPL